MAMRPLKTSEKRLIVAAAATALVLSIYGQIFDPRLARGLELHREIASASRDRSEYQMLLEHRDEILNQAEWLKKQIGAVGSEDHEMKIFLQEIEKLTRDSNLRAVSLRPQRLRETGHYRLLGLDLVAEGGEGEIARFLHAMSDSSQLLRVEMLQINSLRQAGQVQANFNIVRIINPRRPA